MTPARGGEPDVGPLFVAAVAALVGVTAYVLFKPRPASAKKAAKPPPPSVPPFAPPAPASAPQASLSPTFKPPPLYLTLFQDGASGWYGIGWYYGKEEQVLVPGQGLVTKWLTPEGEIRRVLNTLRDEGIAGYFDTIEPVGVEDKNFKGRIDQGANSKGVWYWVDTTYVNGEVDEEAHYESEGQHLFGRGFQEYA
jgi:hypothetical protein